MTSLDMTPGESGPPTPPELDIPYGEAEEPQPHGEFDMHEASMAARRIAELEEDNDAKDQEIAELKEAIAAHEYGKAVRDEAIAAHEFDKAVKQQEIDSAHEQKRDAETLDSLTGLLNVKGIKEKAQAIVDAGRNVGVLYIDAANFKAINDKLGHDVGDDVLKKIAKILEHDIRGASPGSDRTSDAVARVEESESGDAKHPARLHGDEFLIVIGDDGDHSLEDTLTIVRDRILEDIDAMTHADPNLKEIGFGVDLGMAVYDAVADTSVEDAIKRADTNMRFMKRRRQSRDGSYR